MGVWTNKYATEKLIVLDSQHKINCPKDNIDTVLPITSGYFLMPLGFAAVVNKSSEWSGISYMNKNSGICVKVG